ncbi:MAG TPA: Hsp70 family protein, partial [Vicinamibacteria bacterium]
LGQFQLVGIPPAPRGVPQIEVTFDIDANGIVNVSAKDLATSKEQKITIAGSSGLNKSDIDRMVKEAEANRDSDRKKREEIEARNQLDNVVFTAERTLNENRSELDSSLVREVEDALAQAKRTLEGGDAAAFRSASETLSKAAHRMAEALYQKKTAGGEKPGTPTEDVVDAEFTEVN